MYGIYANIGGIWMGFMLPYIAAPWILWTKNHQMFMEAPKKMGRFHHHHWHFWADGLIYHLGDGLAAGLSAQEFHLNGPKNVYSLCKSATRRWFTQGVSYEWDYIWLSSFLRWNIAKTHSTLNIMKASWPCLLLCFLKLFTGSSTLHRMVLFSSPPVQLTALPRPRPRCANTPRLVMVPTGVFGGRRWPYS